MTPDLTTFKTITLDGQEYRLTPIDPPQPETPKHPDIVPDERHVGMKVSTLKGEGFLRMVHNGIFLVEFSDNWYWHQSARLCTGPGVYPDKHTPTGGHIWIDFWGQRLRYYGFDAEDDACKVGPNRQESNWVLRKQIYVSPNQSDEGGEG